MNSQSRLFLHHLVNVPLTFLVALCFTVKAKAQKAFGRQVEK